ncbi:MAG: cytidylate kinase-like family protein [Deltaproteobacteria bacterium]|nr:cytidylate kinase-like family protein [Deltaproteobacteria bacterium]
MTHSIQAIVEKQVSRWYLEKATLKDGYLKGHTPKPVITISRLLGSGASEIAKGVAEELDCELLGIRIMDEVSRRSQIRKELVDAMDERMRSQISDWIDKIFRRQNAVDSDDHYRHLLEVMNYFMELGNVVLLGRGAGFMPKTRPRLDVRIVAPMTRREQRVMKLKGCSHEEAVLTVNASDTHRTQFINYLFGEDWWDSRQYDLTINTANINVASAVDIIKSAWTSYAERHREAWSYEAISALS